MTNALLVTADGSHTLHSTRYGETYHSAHGALQEARHVFIEASGLHQRLLQHRQQSTTLSLLEIGFGLGLNCLLALDKAVTLDARMQYLGLEHDLLNTSLLRTTGYARHLAHPDLPECVYDAVDGYQKNGCNPVFDHKAIRGEIVVGAAKDYALRPGHFDVIFLDAFSPGTNPECWEEMYISQLAESLKKNGVITTYCARGKVRRGMTAAGLCVEKLPGPPGKREMLRATKPV